MIPVILPFEREFYDPLLACQQTHPESGGAVAHEERWHANQIPLQVAVKTGQHYRDTLVAGCPEAADERLFAQALFHACAYWALLPCQFNALSRLSAKDRAWCPTRLQTKGSR